MLYKRSSELFIQAQQVLPGGVNSPVRAFNSVGGVPIFIKKAKGAYLFDEDNKQYIDYIASWGPMLFGHAYAPVVDSIVKRAKKGTSFGTPTEIETQLAKLVVKMVPGIDKVRFVNSGTEACMSAIRLARGFTNREKIIKFSGCYHGHSDSFLIQAGSGAVTFGSPDSPGVTQGTAKDTLVAQYNDIESVKEIFRLNKNQIAAVIIEPVAGNMGCVLPQYNFLHKLRELCSENQSLLIFDEVMTGFRLAPGGAQELFGIYADIVTFGKVVGGGLPVGAFAARNEIMEHLAPLGKVYQAGTLSGNPLAMSAGYAMLSSIEENPDVFDSLQRRTKYLQRGFDAVLSTAKISYKINRIGSMMSVFFTDKDVIDFPSSCQANQQQFARYFHAMLKEGIYLPPSGFESYFLNDALTYDDLDKTINALEKSLKDIK